MLEDVMAKINKDFGIKAVTEGTEMVYCDKIPFSSPTANYMTYGGVPRGKAVEFFGGEGGGKTTTALDVVANAQRIFQHEYEDKKQELTEQLESLKNSKASKKKITECEEELNNLRRQRCLYADTENTLDIEWAQKMGVDTKDLIFMRPENQSAEQVLEAMKLLIETKEVGLAVLDSVPCLVPQQILEESMEKKSYAGVSGPMTVFVSKITPYLTRAKTTFIFINQLRDDINNPYSPGNTPGGRALKHFHSLRIRFKKGDLLDENNREVPSKTENPSGNKVAMEIVKTKICRPDRRLGYYTLNYVRGIDVIADTIEMAERYKFLTKSGAWYYYVDPESGEVITDPDGNELKFQGISKLYNYLSEDEELFDELYDLVDQELIQE